MSLDRNDIEMVELATSSASLDSSPKKNWVENAGGLPPYVRRLARAIMKTGKSKESAIAIAISRIKKWAAGGDGVDADTKAKAAAALAKWEALKAKNKSKKVVKASHSEDGSEYVMLSSIPSFNTDMVRRAWEIQDSARRRARRSGTNDMEISGYRWVRELWTDYIIVETENSDGTAWVKVPYTVSGNVVDFDELNASEVKQVWSETNEPVSLSRNEQNLLKDVLSSRGSRLDQIIALTKQ